VGKEPPAGRRATTAAGEGGVIKKKSPAVCDDRALKANTKILTTPLSVLRLPTATLADVQSALAHGGEA
jgi:hypothetical protein